MLRFAFPCLLMLLAAPAALAHPLPNFRYDRGIDVRLRPEKVEVRYVLLVSFSTIFPDSQKLFTPEEIEQMGGKLPAVSKKYCDKMAPLMAAALDAKLGDANHAFRVTPLAVEQEPAHA